MGFRRIFKLSSSASRINFTVTSSSARYKPIILRRPLASTIARSSTAITTSPSLSPAASAAESGITWAMTAPSVVSIPSASESSGFRFCAITPRRPRRTSPYSMIWRVSTFAILIGMANPIPILPPPGARIAVLMPTSSPRKLTNAPPEFPWLIEASVWIKSS